MESNKSDLKNTGPIGILLYGAPKIGLTTLAAGFPSPLFLNINDDLSHLDVPVVKITSWPQFLKVAKDVISDTKSSRTLVVSQVEDLWQILCDHITQQSNQKNGTSASNISELSFSEWRQALQLFEEKLAKLTSMNNCVFLSHELAEARNVRGLERTHFLLNLERKASLAVQGIVQACGRLFMIEQDLRVLSFIPTENQVTGSRIPLLLEKKWIITPGEKPEFISYLYKQPLKQVV